MRHGASSEFEALKEAVGAGRRRPAAGAGGGRQHLAQGGRHALDQGLRHLADACRSATKSWCRCALDAAARGGRTATIRPPRRPQDFVVAELNPAGLRPSIETTVHALMPQRVVVHVHCVETIALAVQANAEAAVARALARARLGVRALSRGPACRWRAASPSGVRTDTDVLVLGNHGLVVAAETVAEAETLLDARLRRCCAAARPAPAADLAALLRLAAGSDYRLPADAARRTPSQPISRAAASRRRRQPLSRPRDLPRRGLGDRRRPARRPRRSPRRRRRSGATRRSSILLPRQGRADRRDANAGRRRAMARCLADVTARVDRGAARLRYLTAPRRRELAQLGRGEIPPGARRGRAGAAVSDWQMP